MTTVHEPERSKEYRDYRALWELAPKYNFTSFVPIHLDLEVTARCQLKCPGCPSMKLSYEKGDMAFNTALNALVEHRSLGGLSVKFNWRGEPTLYPKLPSVVRYADGLEYVDIMLNTNGVALKPEMADKLLNAGVTTVAWSIDSADSKRYAKLRPGAKLDKVLDNLTWFCEIADNDHDDVFIRVQRIEYPDEDVTHDEFTAFFKKRFPRVNAVASNAYKEKDTSKVWKDVPSEPCAQPWQRLVVTYDGKVGPCCEMNRFKPFGKFPKQTLMEIWNSARMKDLRWRHWACEQNEIPACSKCTVTKVN